MINLLNITMDVLIEIQQLLHSYNPTHVIYGGDMNTDLARSTPQARALRNVLKVFILLYRCARSGSDIYVCKSKRF